MEHTALRDDDAAKHEKFIWFFLFSFFLFWFWLNFKL